jgi:PucR family transcriptional regulator, purine catabolism regulatory protein
MLTVKDLLEIKALEGIQLVAGAQGIHNKISIVNIIENPEVFDWLTANELLLSTGYIFKDSAELQNRVIKELAEINCAGLCIKMKRYFNEIPPNMIELANFYGLPLLELPFGYTLSKVIAMINEHTNADYDSENRRSLDLHNELFKIALEGGGIDRIALELSRTIENPVVILDKDWNVLYYADYEKSRVPLEALCQHLKYRPMYLRDFIESLPDNLSDFKKSVKRTMNWNGQELKCRVMPVAVSNTVYGYILVIQSVRKLSEFDYYALEHSSTILALERIKAKEIEEVKLKIKQDFFDDLLTGKITSNETLQSLCGLHGLKVNRMCSCMVIDLHWQNKYEDLMASKNEMDLLTKKYLYLVYERSAKRSLELVSLHRNNRIILLLGHHDSVPAMAVNESKSFANELHEIFETKIKNSKYQIGIGRPVQSIHTVHKSFSEAFEVLSMIQKFNEKWVVSHFEDYSIYHFLDSNIKSSELENFFQRNLGEIYEQDLKHGTRLMETIESYFSHNRNVSEASKAMFIHRNTFIYRIEKIKEILSSDLKNPEELLQLQIALKIFKLIR